MNVVRIWDRSPHNAFTDLAVFQGRLFCTFREGRAHVSEDGALRVLVSTDGRRWDTATTVEMGGVDLRDPKLCTTADNRLMLTAAGVHRLEDGHLQTYAWTSEDGFHWPNVQPMGECGYWLWRVCWIHGTALSLGYNGQEVRLYRARKGEELAPVAPYLLNQDYPNEFDMVEDGSDGCLCLIRRDKGRASALLGHSVSPYDRWTWLDLQVRIGGPHLTRRPDGELLAVVRLYDEPIRTAVCRLDKEEGRLTELLALPSGGDCSYAGSLFFDGKFLVSYYSEHEGKCAIYLATLTAKEIGIG